MNCSRGGGPVVVVKTSCAWLALVGLAALPAACDNGTDWPSTSASASTSPSAPDEVIPGGIAASAEAATFLSDLRQRFSVATADFPLLPSDSTTTLVGDGNGMRARFAAAARAAATAHASLPGHAADWSTVELPEARSLGLSFRLLGAAARTAAVADGYALYRDAVGDAALLTRATPDGIEDYVYFPTSPAASEVRYQVRLAAGVAGLRLVANTLELVDAAGNPRLRVAPPFLVDARRQRIDARLAVEGCAVDTDATMPWGRTPVAAGADACTVVITWDAAAVAYPALLDPSWTTTASMATPRAFHTATLLSTSGAGTGKVMVIGGLTTNAAVTASCEIYSQATSTWAATTAIPVGRNRHVAVNLNDAANTVFVSGGYRDTVPTASAGTYTYTPGNATWANWNNMAVARAVHAASVATNGSGQKVVVVTGGYTDAGSTVTQTVELFNGSTHVWTTGASSTSTKRAGHASVLRSNGDVLITGGSDGTNITASALSYKLSSNTWTSVGSMSEARHGHTATRLGSGKILVTGGRTQRLDITATSSADLFIEGASPTWRATADMTRQRYGHTASLLADDTVVVVGGVDRTSTPVTLVELYKPTWETFTEWTALPAARALHAAAVLTTTVASGLPNKVLITGGASSVTPVSTSTFYATTYLSDMVSANPAVTVAEYSETPSADPFIAADLTDSQPPPNAPQASRQTQIWGALFRPTTMVAGQRYPIIVLLHGNHDSCGNTAVPRIDDKLQDSYNDGVCPAGYSVVKSFRGYDYLARELAQRGYVVVSINANRGIAGRDDGPDVGNTNEQYYDHQLIQVRGRLVLKHLQRLSEWDRGVSATPASIGISLQGRLDLSQVGLLGHSRGGEGVRSALTQYRISDSYWPGARVSPNHWQTDIPGLQIRAIFDIATTDGGVGTGASPIPQLVTNVKYVALLPLCEWGENTRDAGIQVFDRTFIDLFSEVTPNFKAAYSVYGANHRYYNTEWQVSDANPATDCLGQTPLFTTGAGITGSARQRQTAVHSVVHFFTGTVGASADPNQALVFNPNYALPPWPRVDRAYLRAPMASEMIDLENFCAQTGWSEYGIPTTSSNVTAVQTIGGIYNHPATQCSAQVTWNTSTPSTFFETDWAGIHAGFDLRSYTSLDFRVDRMAEATQNSSSSTDFEVRLINADGTLTSAVKVSPYVTLTGPAGMPDDGDGGGFTWHVNLQTVRMPLSAFTGANLAAIRGMRFYFTQTSSGAVHLSNVIGSR